ncbi:hypothetical protein JD974_12590 [Chromobacterium haemolyticum]|uniref:Uncharacterized protein n=1 Tax=Chromobacterium haemolyticum TaxID=394935 RepID=A0ABS3GNB3_9NEIS|nr:hypothetical protein [Chromobacterium haemolyticum]MBK0415244.1 hypothetical protein [Chromobacterium haemolyticum]MBO0416541.1 hypothetical protein [Chromobacterium haemolyticum]MBO0499883.1 hypothetical protein [Chromobacterium haemolyticum]
MALAANSAARYLSLHGFVVTFVAGVRDKQPNEGARLYLLSAGFAFMKPGLAIKLAAAALAPGDIVILGSPIVD